MAPSRYLGLPWPEWGQTDVALNMAIHTLDAMACRCGCGQYADEAHDPSTEGRWQVHAQKCYAAAALSEYKREHEGDLKDTILHATLLRPGEEASDAMQYDPETARREYEEHQRRFGLA